MNPFTESTVARPLSEPFRPAANDTAARGGPAPDAQTPSNNAASPPAPAKKHRLSREPRSLRLARQRARNAARQARILRPVRRWGSVVSGRNQIGPPPSVEGEQASLSDLVGKPAPLLSVWTARRLFPAQRVLSGRFLAGVWAAYCRWAATAALGLGLALGLSAAWAVNVNSASAQQLETITGIGPKTAQIIIDERTRGGSFESFEDLAERVKGIGPKKAKSLQAAGLTVGQGGAAPNPPTPTPAVQRKAGK